MAKRLINLAEIKEEDEQLLIELFTQDVDTTRWKKKKEYLVNGDSLELSHAIVKRQNKKGEWRYEIVNHDKKLGAGAFGKVFEILATVKIEKELNRLIKRDKNRAIKIQTESKPGEIIAEREQKLSPDYLKAKGPYFWSKIPKPDNFNPDPKEQRISGLIMKKIPGLPIGEVMKNLPMLTSDQKFNFALSLLDALVKHVHKKGYAHQDLDKPNNILVDVQMDSVCVDVYIIDFGAAIDTKIEQLKTSSPLSDFETQDRYYIAQHVAKILDSYLESQDNNELPKTLVSRIVAFNKLANDWSSLTEISSDNLVHQFCQIYDDYYEYQNQNRSGYEF